MKLTSPGPIFFCQERVGLNASDGLVAQAARQNAASDSVAAAPTALTTGTAKQDSSVIETVDSLVQLDDLSTFNMRWGSVNLGSRN